MLKLFYMLFKFQNHLKVDTSVLQWEYVTENKQYKKKIKKLYTKCLKRNKL